jgi:hypothetical protein
VTHDGRDLGLGQVSRVPSSNDYTDPEGYWVCPEGGIRPIGDEAGELEVAGTKADAQLRCVLA